MGLFEGRGNLGKQMKDLRERWHATRMDWDDEQARRFEERFIMNLDADLRTAISAMDDMAALLGQIRQECD
jgi:hypothetical protein